MIINKSDVFDLFANNINQFVFWKDRDSIYQGCNKNFANYAGFDDPKEIRGSTDYDMPWDKEEADFFRKIDQEVMTSGDAQLNFEEPQTLADGSKRWISTSKVPILDADKKVIGILGWYIDITPYKSMQLQIDEKNKALFEYSQELVKTNIELEKANRDMEMFTYAVSHDLKSPIKTIVSISDLVIKSNDGKVDGKIIEILKYINNTGKNMNNLVLNILTYARSGLEDLSSEKVQINNLIAKKITDLDQIVLKENTIVKVAFPNISIYCYPDLLGIVFFNLIGNGLKYNKSDSPIVHCTMEEGISEFVFSIKDNGMGISTEFHKKIFEPFKRLHTSEIEGTGLGLSICKRIIELHKGKIWIENDDEIGTNIKFSISKNIDRPKKRN